MPRLIVIKGADEGKQFELNQPVLGIGRDATNIIRLHDTEVSRRHAEFRTSTTATAGCSTSAAPTAPSSTTSPSRKPCSSRATTSRSARRILVYSSRPDGRATAANLADDQHDHPADVELSSAIIKTIGEPRAAASSPSPTKRHALAANALANLGVMYEASQAVSHILDLDQLLERILELIFRSIEADRGCIMLGDGSPAQSRAEGRALARRDRRTDEKIAVSRTIMDHVLQEKQGVLVSDALRDERFNTGQSIVSFGIREVICVPMKGRHETLGVLYLDTHSHRPRLMANAQPGGQVHRGPPALAIAIAHQAALAVEETRYHQAMVQAERLAAIGQTIAALSHHIKNILQGLRSGSEILKMGLADKNDELLQQGWKIVEKNQGKIYDLVMDMLSYSKEREPAIEATDLNALSATWSSCWQAGPRRLGVKLEMQPGRGTAAGAGRPGGHPPGAAEHRRQRPRRRRGAAEPAGRASAPRCDSEPGWVRIVVLDNGVGIPPKKLATSSSRSSAPRGPRAPAWAWPVSRKILREHGGDILVQSQPGRGRPSNTSSRRQPIAATATAHGPSRWTATSSPSARAAPSSSPPSSSDPPCRPNATTPTAKDKSGGKKIFDGLIDRLDTKAS